MTNLTFANSLLLIILVNFLHSNKPLCWCSNPNQINLTELEKAQVWWIKCFQMIFQPPRKETEKRDRKTMCLFSGGQFKYPVGVVLSISGVMGHHFQAFWDVAGFGERFGVTRFGVEFLQNHPYGYIDVKAEVEPPPELYSLSSPSYTLDFVLILFVSLFSPASGRRHGWWYHWRKELEDRKDPDALTVVENCFHALDELHGIWGPLVSGCLYSLCLELWCQFYHLL